MKPFLSFLLTLLALSSTLTTTAQIKLKEQNGQLYYKPPGAPTYKPASGTASSTTVVSGTLTSGPYAFTNLVGVPTYLTAAALNAKLDNSVYLINRQADQNTVAALQSQVSGHVNATTNPHNTTKAQVGLANVPNVDATNPANLSQSSNYRFVSDGEKTAWNLYGTAGYVRGFFGSSGDLLFDPTTGQFGIKNAQFNTLLANYLRSREGFADGKVLQAQGNDFAWVTATAGTTSGTSTAPATTTTAVPADSTVNRVNYALLTDEPISTTAQLATILSTNQTNKRFVLAAGTFNLGSQILLKTGSWNNVAVVANPAATTITTSGSTVLFLINASDVNRVQFNGVVFRSTSTSGGSPVVTTNELVGFHGLEFARCQFIGTGSGNYNGFGIAQYSTGSNSGATSSDLYIHNCLFLNIPRMGMEILSQGYDAVRLTNVTIVRNRFENQSANPGENHRMASSLSGLITGVYHASNNSLNAKDITYEFVNTKYVLAENNTGTSTLEVSTGYSITDDGRNTTERIYIRGGNFNVLGRPLVIYDAKDVHVDGLTAIGGRGIDMKAKNCSFENLNVTVRSTDFEAIWQFDNTSVNNVLKNSTLSSWGSAAAGRNPSFETVVLRPGTSGNVLTYLTLKQGKKSDGTYFTNGQPVNQGAGTNTVDAFTTNNVQLEP